MFSLTLIIFSIFIISQSGNATNIFGGSNVPTSYCTTMRNPCLNGGTCADFAGTYRCICRPECAGRHCETCRSNDAVCAPNPCKGDCECRESCQHSGGYYCRSNSGFLGKNCTVPVPQLRCEPDSIVISVAESFVLEYDLGLRNSYIKVTPTMDSTQFCKVTTTSFNSVYEYRIPFPFNTCGTIATQGADGTMIFTNQMWFNRQLSNTMFDVPLPVIQFECRYKREYRIVTSLQPVIPTPAVITADNLVFPTISLCKVASCPATCPVKYSVNGGGVYTVGEMIHVRMTLDAGSFVTAIESMFLSCSSTPSGNSRVEIVTNGCGTRAGLPCKVSQSAVSSVVCVSFQTPRAMGCPQFYIHAKLSSCTRGNVQTCSSDPSVRYCTNNRGKRSTGSEPITVGPIYFVDGTEGIGRTILNGLEEDNIDIITKRLNEAEDLQISASPSNEIPQTSESSTNTGFDPVVVLIVSAIIFMFLIVFLIIYIRSLRVGK